MKWHKFMKFCPDDYMLIENYELALADNFKGWICHHINGEIKSKEELIELGLYYNVLSGNFRGHHHTVEAKRKIGEASKGNQYGKGKTAWNKGMRTSPKWSKVTKWKLSEETKNKHSKAMKEYWARKRGEHANPKI